MAVVGFAGFGAERIWRLHANDAPLRSAIETGIVLSALASAGLLLAHFRQTRLLRDLLLLAALATVALTDFVFNALPAHHYETGIYGAGARMALSVVIAGIFLAVAFAPAHRRVIGGRRLVRIAVPAAICWVALGELVDLMAGPVRDSGPLGIYRPMSVAVALIAFGLLVVSACGFAERRSRGDIEAGLLAAAALLMAGAQLTKLAVPVVPADWVMPADALRIGAYSLLLVTAVRMYRRSRDQMARDALTAERRRIAQDLHDGLAQDLAFIAAHSERLAQEYGADHPLAIAAQRALAHSRGKIVDLEATDAPTTEAALRKVAAEFGDRFGVDVTVTVENADRCADATRSEPERRELVRIAREAIANAVNHGGARNVCVELGAPNGTLLLRVTDDGCGFAGADASSSGTGLGMTAMRRRATKLGAQLRAGATECGGARIDVIA
ncbi:MAG TPA: ATP-binding protein, partial [Solirubrobacteraceae bacterium]|nr:ATP-binding protein [Solirubrobacteraceae bacterium]